MADQVIENGRIIAYKIFWFGGGTSGWYVPGLNDLGPIYNPTGIVNCGLPYHNNTMRRRWAMFNDHKHEFIICKARDIEL